MPPATRKHAYGYVPLRKVSACLPRAPRACPHPASHPSSPPMQYAGLLDLLDLLSPAGPIPSRFPLTFEAIKQVSSWAHTLGRGPRAPVCGCVSNCWLLWLCHAPQAHGFVLYRTWLPRDVWDPVPLSAPPHSVCDLAYVLLDGVRPGPEIPAWHWHQL